MSTPLRITPKTDRLAEEFVTMHEDVRYLDRIIKEKPGTADADAAKKARRAHILAMGEIAAGGTLVVLEPNIL